MIEGKFSADFFRKPIRFKIENREDQIVVFRKNGVAELRIENPRII